MSWVHVIPMIAGLVTVIVLPGGVALWLLRVRGPLAWAGGAAITSGLFGMAAIVYGAVGIGWNLRTVALLVLVLWAGCAIVGRRLEVRGAHPQTSRRQRSNLWTWAGAAVGTIVISTIVVRAMVTPDALRQGFDSFDAPFHLNAVRLIRDVGNASSFDALVPLHGDALRTAFYPAVWHSMVAIAPGGASISAAGNMSTLVFIAIWCLGIAALVHEVFPRRPEAALVAPVLAACFGVFPNPSFGTHAQWPWGAALALVPGVLALGCAALGIADEAERSRSARLTLWAVAVAGAAGAVIMHGSVIATLAVFAFPALVVAGITAVWRARIHGRAAVLRIAVPASTVGLLVVGAAVVAWNAGLFAAVTGFSRPERMPAQDALRYAVRGFAPDAMPRQLWPILVMLMVGIIASFVVRAGQWFVPALAAIVVLFAAAAGPDGTPLRWLTGLWYTDSLRISAFYPVAAAPLAALGFSVVARWCVSGAISLRQSRGGVAAQPSAGVRLTAAAAIAAVGVGGALAYTRGARLVDIRDDFVAAYSPPLEARTIDPGTQDLLGRLGDLIPPGSVLIGEPFTGAAYAYAVSGVDVEFANSALANLSADQSLLVQSFNRIHVDPAVCEAVQRLGVTHLWADGAPWLPSLERAPGLFDVDVSAGFEEIARSGSVSVYRITACDE